MSLKTIFAEELLWKITDGKHEFQQGVTALLSGGMGSGKTTLLLHLLDYLYADGREVVFWRGREIDQWHHADHRVEFRIFHHVDDRIQFEADSEIKQYYELYPYKTIREIIRNADSEMVNVVYPPSADWRAEYSDQNLVTIYKEYKQARILAANELNTTRHAFWYSFIYEMLKLKSFASLFFDEFDDIAERYAKGYKYYMLNFLMNALRYFRQRKLSLYGATQVVTDIDSRILGKMMFYLYMAGSKVHRDSILDPKKVKFAELGHAFIEEKNTGTWAKFSFPDRGIITTLLVTLRGIQSTEDDDFEMVEVEGVM
ncbi:MULTISPECIES: hypothetical protein [unclassified Archaeoglobus]|uniref:hypothetical protein n=1 Tax=unclassified Archaeoglobus TaxID=2643606 RepID=UPI0025BC4266|nr:MULTISPECIES: hypothetical protein [unclassified Archaeoglobus]